MLTPDTTNKDQDLYAESMDVAVFLVSDWSKNNNRFTVRREQFSCNFPMTGQSQQSVVENYQSFMIITPMFMLTHWHSGTQWQLRLIGERVFLWSLQK